ncbi:SDR family oxidoreductase, partial [Mycolicibacter arupensis]|uniref:SDR family oxidoreductase n=1 Tax=Mycolicibacter arupensis TaxID=342002 RepID=UPI003B3A529E
TEQYRPGYLESVSGRIVLGKMGDPEDLAASVLWLASDAGGYVTGQTNAVDGGFTIN